MEKKKNFNSAIKKVFNEINKKKKSKKVFPARFICCLTLYWPNGKVYSSKGVVNGKISMIKKGKKGFGYDPIFIPHGYNKTFAEMHPRLNMNIDHRHKAYAKIKRFF